MLTWGYYQPADNFKQMAARNDDCGSFQATLDMRASNLEHHWG
ncbi:conserved protein of unknown function [Limnospira indica PCC 8005]|uniref:Uncharacterized protein n=1 Tax=Limnospira indica PCC 8005 TaxID=376219 RepID=A0A9P1KEN6_9CYAN|nr:conserved protein of unknown function [Limnospira indica PCC 8005]